MYSSDQFTFSEAKRSDNIGGKSCVESGLGTEREREGREGEREEDG